MPTYPIEYKRRLSEAITQLRFPLIVFIIMLHCFSVKTIPGEHALYFKAVYSFALWLGETGVPGFFFISGYLFFLSKKKYKQKIQNRIYTLLVPYLLWNSLLIVLYLFAYMVGYPQEINGKNLSEYSLFDYYRLFWDRGLYDNGNFVPLLCPLWYIRNLLIMSILSPIFYYLIRYLREVFLLTVSIWWLMTNHNAFIPQTVLFFCLGAYFPILGINPLKVAIEKKRLFISLFMIFAISDIFTHCMVGTSYNLQIHRISLIFNIPALLLVADWSVRHGYTNQLFPNAAFIVFCVHYPIVVILRKICISQFANASDGIHILLYFVCVLLATIISIGCYLVLDRYFPQVKRILSGNR